MGNYRETGRYGRCYYCIGLVDGTEVYVHADRLELHPTGAVLAFGGFYPNAGRGDYEADAKGEDQTPRLAFAAGQWTFFYAASVMDGAAVAVEHWPGQIVE